MKRRLPRRKIAERDMTAPLRRLFPAARFAMLTEVPFNGKSIDVLLLDRRTRRLIAVELKLDKWRKALRQAAAYQLCAHAAYVGLPENQLDEISYAAISDHGLGVISFRRAGRGLSAQIICRPRATGLMNRDYARQVRKLFEHAG